MNISEKIALDCGVKMDFPYLDRYYIPTANHDFIIFDTRCKNPIGEYDFFTDVFELIQDYLIKNNIEIYQIADDKNIKLQCNRCFININKKQENYLISNAKLVISNENYSLYIASVFNVKSIGLYSLNHHKNTRPFWNKNSQIILESHREGNLPSYGVFNEIPKTINFISPFEVAKQILDSLEIKNKFDKYELVYLGKNFNQKIIEIIPDFTSGPDFMKNQSLNLRLDYVDSLNTSVFHYWLTGRKINIITDKDINLGLLQSYKNNILLITVMITENISENFLNLCKMIGLKIKIYCEDKEKLNKYRFKFLDWDIHKDFDDNNSFENHKNLSASSKFISSKILISKGKKYSCKANFFLNKPLDKNGENVILSKEFEQEIEFFKIYNERQEESTTDLQITKHFGID